MEKQKGKLESEQNGILTIDPEPEQVDQRELDLKVFSQFHDLAIDNNVIKAILVLSPPEVEQQPNQLGINKTTVTESRLAQPSNVVREAKRPYRPNAILQSRSTFYNLYSLSIIIEIRLNRKFVLT